MSEKDRSARSRLIENQVEMTRAVENLFSEPFGKDLPSPLHTRREERRAQIVNDAIDRNNLVVIIYLHVESA